MKEEEKVQKEKKKKEEEGREATATEATVTVKGNIEAKGWAGRDD